MYGWVISDLLAVDVYSINSHRSDQWAVGEHNEKAVSSSRCAAFLPAVCCLRPLDTVKTPAHCRSTYTGPIVGVSDFRTKMVLSGKGIEPIKRCKSVDHSINSRGRYVQLVQSLQSLGKAIE